MAGKRHGENLARGFLEGWRGGQRSTPGGAGKEARQASAALRALAVPTRTDGGPWRGGSRVTGAGGVGTSTTSGCPYAVHNSPFIGVLLMDTTQEKR